jgi:hypothetical protein
VDWIDLPQYRDWWQTHVNTEINVCVPQKARNLIIWATISFWKTHSMELYINSRNAWYYPFRNIPFTSWKCLKLWFFSNIASCLYGYEMWYLTLTAEQSAHKHTVCDEPKKKMSNSLCWIMRNLNIITSSIVQTLNSRWLWTAACGRSEEILWTSWKMSTWKAKKVMEG